MDVYSTKDEVQIVMHDEPVDRTTNGVGYIQDLTFSELRELDAGYSRTSSDDLVFPYRGLWIQILSLEDVLTAFPDALLNFEIKQTKPSIVKQLFQTIQAYGMVEHVLIASFDLDTIRNFRKTCPEVITTAGEGEVRMLYGLAAVYLGGIYPAPAEAVQVPEFWGKIHVVKNRFIQAVHGRKMDVHVWTVNEASEMHRMLDLGVDGIITDNPDILLALLGR